MPTAAVYGIANYNANYLIIQEDFLIGSTIVMVLWIFFVVKELGNATLVDKRRLLSRRFSSSSCVV